MADSQVFEKTCELVEELTPLNQLEARSVVGLALAAASLNPTSVGRHEMIAAIHSSLARELGAHHVNDVRSLCAKIVAALQRFESSEASPYEIFSKLG